MAERKTRTVVGYVVDRASINQVVVGNQAIRQSIEGVRDVLGDLNPATAASVNMLTTRFDALGRNLQDDMRIVEDLRAELLALDDVVVEPEVRVQQTTSDRGGRNTSGLDTTDRLGSIGSQIFSGLGQGQLANAAGLVGDIAGAAGALGPLGVAAAALAPAIAVVTNEINKNTEKERERASALRTVAEAIVNGTRTEVEAKITALRVDNTVSEQQIRLIEERTGKSREYFESLAQTDITDFGLIGGLANLSANLQGLGGDAGVVADANKQIEDNAFLIEALTAVLTGNATAANDTKAATEAATAAEYDLADARRQTFIDEARRAGQDLADRANNRLEVDRMTAEQRQARAAEIQRQIELLSADRQSYLAQQTTAGGQAAYLLGQQIADLQDELIRVTDTTLTYADVLAAEEARKKALSTQTENYLDAVTAEVKAQEKAFTARQEYAQAVAEGAAKERELVAQTELKREEIITDSRDRLTDIEDKGAKERVRILRDFNRTYTSAVGERDALAGKNAKLAASDRLTDQQEGYDEQLRTQTKALDKQLKALDRSYTDQYARLVQGLNAELSTRQMAINRAVTDVANAENYKAAVAMNGAGTQRSIHEYMWGQLNQTAVAWASNTVNSVRGIMGAYTGSYANQYPMSIGNQPPVTLNYNVAPTNALTANQFRSLIQSAAGRSGGGGYRL